MNVNENGGNALVNDDFRVLRVDAMDGSVQVMCCAEWNGWSRGKV